MAGSCRVFSFAVLFIVVASLSVDQGLGQLVGNNVAYRPGESVQLIQGCRVCVARYADWLHYKFGEKHCAGC